MHRWLVVMALAVGVAGACGSEETGQGGAAASGGSGAAGAHGGSGGSGALGGGGGGVDPCSLHVAPDGTGTACTAQAPCALEAARALVRSEAPAMTADIVVCLHDGSYRLGATFELTGELDSGRNGHEVVYTAAPGASPELSGGVPVTGWQPASGGQWRATVPQGLATRQLYVNGERARRARGATSPPGFQTTASGYTAPDAAMAGWANPSDIEVVSFVLWKSFRCPVAAISGTTITMAQPCWALSQWHSCCAMAAPTWIENAHELLDEPGEWYLDWSESAIYYLPRPGEDLSSAEVVVPVLQTLVTVTGTAEAPATAIRLRGLALRDSTWLGPGTPEGYPVLQAGYVLRGDPASPHVEKTPGAVVLRYSRGVTLERNRFERLGSTALVIERSQDDVVAGNLFRDVSGGAVHLGDVDDPNPASAADVPSGLSVHDNVVTDTGRELFDTVAIFAGYVAGAAIEHNELSNVPYSGISVGWGWSQASTLAQNNVVRANLVHNVMQRLQDGGLVYTLSAQPGTLIERNYFHDLLDLYGGIYLDQGSQFITVQDNVVTSVPYWMLLQPTVAPAAQDNVVQNNFSDTDQAFCCGSLGCCTDINTVAGNVVVAPGVPASWPAAAVSVMAEAGLSPAYADVRPSSSRIEAEDYLRGGEGIGYHDLTAGNLGGAYRGDDVDLYGGAPFSNEVVLGYTETGEWTQYYVDVPSSGSCSVDFSVGTQDATDAIELAIDGVSAGSLTLPDTGSWQTFTTASLPAVSMTQGPHLARLTFTGGFNLDYFVVRCP